MKAHFDGPNTICLIAVGEDEQKRMNAIAEGHQVRISCVHSVFPTGFHSFSLEFKQTNKVTEPDEVVELKRRIHSLEQEIKVDNELLAERDRLLAMIPACPIHGAGCIPWAMKWIHDALGHDTTTEV